MNFLIYAAIGFGIACIGMIIIGFFDDGNSPPFDEPFHLMVFLGMIVAWPLAFVAGFVVGIILLMDQIGKRLRVVVKNR